nr:FecR domain-containing protein [uncultured Chitinophaga sp.]
MKSNLYIQRLMTEKIGGNISAADECYLDHLIETDGVVATAWEKTRQLYNEEDIKDNFHRFNDVQWQEMPFQAPQSIIPQRTPTPQEKRFGKISSIAWAVAASLLMLAAVAWWLFRTDKPSARGLSLTDPQAGVQLQLGSGKILNLSKDSGVLHTAATQLINTTKSLSLSESTIPGKHNNENLTLAVPIGKYYTIKLSDGTEVALNAASTLRFPVPFSADTREVYLSGEAFLTVARDAARPFLVHTAQGTVQVLGTSFNVNTYDSGSVKVSLVDGMVKMEDVPLKPGQQAVATNTGIRVQPFDEPEELSWRRGVFYFSNTTLADIARILPRWFGIPVIMDNNSIATETFTGSLERNQPVAVFLDNLKSTTTVDYYFDKNGRLHFK